jgi:di/tricarboxylate transporter
VDALLVLFVVVVVVALLVSEAARPDLVAMGALAFLVLTRILNASEALSGFGNFATITVACMFVLSEGLRSSGVVAYLGDRLLRHGPTTEIGLVVAIGFIIGMFSAFINNTAAVAVFIPVAVHASHGNNISPSRILMPMSFLAMLGGTCTLIGTSTNILVSSLAEQHGIRPFRMFEFGPLGVVLLVAGGAYLVLVGRWLLPERVSADRNLTRRYNLSRYLSEIEILPGSSLAGQALSEAGLGERHELEVLALIRNGEDPRPPGASDRLHEGDRLLVKAPVGALMALRDPMGLAILSGNHPDYRKQLSADGVLVEAVITPQSSLEGRTLKGADFRNHYGATALAIRKPGESVLDKIGKVRLRVGDQLLILAHRNHLDLLKRQTDFVVVQELEVPQIRPARALVAVSIIAGVVVTAATGLYPIAISALVGSLLMILTGCLPLRMVHRSVDWSVIVLLAGLIPLGIALEKSGAAGQAVRGVMLLLGASSPNVVLSVMFLGTALLTGFISNTATAALMVPLAITTAQALGVDPHPFLIAVTFAASNLLVHGPGGYRFLDYLRAGGPLNLICWLLATWLIPVFFPFG